ncbi:MAG: hypothetical protein GY870_12360, partial [archaeon]|nr:hypothetical protein [archaeon]
ISVDIYSKLYGAHEVNPKQPWHHLLNKDFKPTVYVNKLRLEDYKKIFSNHFKKIQFICKEDPEVKKHLTPELKKMLSKYSEMELTMFPLVIMGEK